MVLLVAVEVDVASSVEVPTLPGRKPGCDHRSNHQHDGGADERRGAEVHHPCRLRRIDDRSTLGASDFTNDRGTGREAFRCLTGCRRKPSELLPRFEVLARRQDAAKRTATPSVVPTSGWCRSSPSQRQALITGDRRHHQFGHRCHGQTQPMPHEHPDRGLRGRSHLAGGS